MTALTDDRSTPLRSGNQFNDAVASGVLIYAGALVMLNADGNATPATESSGLTVRGVAEAYVDNSSGSAGDKSVDTQKGTFRFCHDSLTRSDIGSNAYAVDDQTVDTDSTDRSLVGAIVDIDDVGVWVEII